MHTSCSISAGVRREAARILDAFSAGHRLLTWADAQTFRPIPINPGPQIPGMGLIFHRTTVHVTVAA
jgi:hypothetical protein